MKGSLRSVFALLSTAVVGIGCSGGSVVLTPAKGTPTSPSTSSGIVTPTPPPGASATATPTPGAKTATPTATPGPGSPTPTPTPTMATTGTFTPPGGACVSGSDTLTAQGGTETLPATSGFSGDVVFPANNAGSGVALSMTFCPGGDPPSAVANTVIPAFLAGVGGTPIAYVILQPLASSVTFTSTTSSFSLTMPASAFPPGGTATQYFVAGCDEASCDVSGPVSLSIPDVVGPLPLNGSTVSLSSTDPSLSNAAPPPSMTAPTGHTLIAFVYASPYSPELQYRHLRLNDKKTR